MRALVQRVSRAKVTVDGKITGSIGPGLLIFLGVKPDDDDNRLGWMAKKCANLRVFADEEGKMNRSLLDTGGEALVVSQFTLYGDSKKGNRPSYIHAAGPEIAEPLYERFCEALSRLIGKEVSKGIFGAEMAVDLVNDGPVTIWIDRE